MIVYVTRDKSNHITGVFACQQSFPTDTIDDSDDGVVAFLNPPQSITVQMWQAEQVMKATAFIPSNAAPQYQAALASANNIWDAAQIIIAAMNNNTLAAWWDRATTISSNDDTLLQLAASLGLTTLQVSQMFTQAQSVLI